MADAILEEDRGEVRLLTLNRPQALNAVSTALRTALIEALRRADGDERVRALVLTGVGRAFCAGQDLAEALAYEPRQLRPWLDQQRAMYQAVRDVSKPCLAAINGTAAGAGIQIALCCDLRIAHAGAKLGQPEVRAGLASIVGSYLIGLHCGLGHNVELSMTGGLVSGERAHALGLVTELVPEERVLERAFERAAELARLPGAALRITKRRFRDVTQAGFDAACEAGVAAQLEAYATGEPQRIMQAFLDKRSDRRSAS